MDADNSLGLLLIGAPGAGKSTTLTHLHDALDANGVESAAIDADELARSYPPISFDRHVGHVRDLARSYLNADHTLLIIAVTVESDDQLAEWLEATTAAEHLVVHLVASSDVLEERVRAREDADWQGLGALVAAARRLAPTRFARTDLEIDTEAAKPAAIASSLTDLLTNAR